MVTKTSVRVLAGAFFLLSSAILTASTSVSAAAAVKTYKDSANHYYFQYPASWNLDTKLSDITSLASSMGVKAGAEVNPADNAAYFAVLVKPAATSKSTMRSEVTALVKEGVTLTGPMKYKDNSANYGGNALAGGANVKFDAKHAGYVAIQAYVHRGETYYILTSELTKPQISSTEHNLLNQVEGSYTSS